MERKLKILVSDEVKEFLIEKGYDKNWVLVLSQGRRKVP